MANVQPRNANKILELSRDSAKNKGLDPSISKIVAGLSSDHDCGAPFIRRSNFFPVNKPE